MFGDLPRNLSSVVRRYRATGQIIASHCSHGTSEKTLARAWHGRRGPGAGLVRAGGLRQSHRVQAPGEGAWRVIGLRCEEARPLRGVARCALDAPALGARVAQLGDLAAHCLRQPVHVVQAPLPVLGEPALAWPVVEGPRLLQFLLALQQQRLQVVTGIRLAKPPEHLRLVAVISLFIPAPLAPAVSRSYADCLSSMRMARSLGQGASSGSGRCVPLCALRAWAAPSVLGAALCLGAALGLGAGIGCCLGRCLLLPWALPWARAPPWAPPWVLPWALGWGSALALGFVGNLTLFRRGSPFRMQMFGLEPSCGNICLPVW